jgi:hypothetical protein
MKRTYFLIAGLALISLAFFSAKQNTSSPTTTSVATKDDVKVYYFHFTRRCLTCQAVENVTKEALEEYYGNKVTFTGLNLDETDGVEKGKVLGIDGQTLIIVSGDTKINLTNEGFMYARANPDKLKSLIKEKVDSLL